MRRTPLASFTALAALALLTVAGCQLPLRAPAAPAEPAAEEALAAPSEELAPAPEELAPPPPPEPVAPPPPPPKPASAPKPAAAPTGEAAPAAKPAARLERGTNRPGGDYSNFALDTPDPSGCRMACEQEERCRAFTYTQPGVMGEMAYCALKETVPPATPSSCCVSGVK
jgi:hypothetical protein